jgi:DNA polymerase-3 subunit delta
VTPDELERELAAGRVRPAYAVVGGEPLLRDQALAALRRCVLAGGPVDFNFDRIEGDAATAGALWDAVRTLPVGAARRLVWLREPAAPRQAAGSAGRSRALADALPEIVRALDADARTVLVVTAGAIDRRLAWVRAFSEAGALVECEPPQGTGALADFARREATRLGIRIEPAAAEHLAELVGPQLLRLRSELEKASLLAGRGETVTLDHVSRAVADLAEEPVWALTDAIGDGRTGDALAGLSKILAAGGAPPVVLATLAGHFRRLLRLRAGGSIAAPPFVRKKLEGQSRRYAPGRLLGCLRAIHETDEMLKGQGGLRPELALERLVIGLSA